MLKIMDLNGNVITFSYGQHGISQITDTVGRTVTFNYSSDKLTSITDGIRTISYSYSGGKLTAVTDPIGRVTTYEYMSQNSFLITGVHYPSGGFSSYEYGTVIPEAGKIAPYKSSETEDGVTQYYFYKVDSPDTVTWTSPKDLAGVTGAAGRPYVVQRDDGSFVMYFKEKYVWTETVWKCGGGDCWEEIITHTEYWIKRSTSTDQQHWSTPQNVLQVKSTTGNPVVIEKQDGSLIMYYMDHYQWTEEQCELVGRCPWDCEWVCETITHTEFYIYRRSSSDGITWGSPVKVQQTTLGVRNIAAIQKQDGKFLLVCMDKVGSAYYMRQKTSADGLSWGTASNVVLVDSGTGNPALLEADSGAVYLAYRKGNSSLYVTSNSGSGWSSPVQTTGVASGDPAFLQTETEIVLIYKGTDSYCYRISSSDGSSWSSPSQIAPNKIVSDPASVQRTDRSYRVATQYISASALDLVKITEFSYTGSGYLSESTDVLIRDSQTLKSSMHFEYDSNPMKYTDPLGFSAEDIVRDIFNNIFDIDPETLGEDLDKLIEEAGGDVLEVLKGLFSIMGFEGYIDEFFVDADTTREGLVIKLEMDGTDYGSITIYGADLDSGTYGLYHKSKTQPTVEIDFGQCATVAEVITTALHEICHHVLGKEYPKMNTRVQHYYIYKVQIEVQNEVKKVADDPYSLKWSIVMRLKWVECYWLPEKLK